jgi:hypothetical protein
MNVTLEPYPKYLARQNRALVRELFMREWDPIGVKDEPAAQDEYNTYVDKAYVMLMHESASIEQITDYLYGIETENMGLFHSDQAKERARRAARSLTALKSQFEGQ